MARSKIHLAGKTNDDGRVMPQCPGDHRWGYSETTADEALVTCPTCLGIIHRRQLAQRPADAVAVALEKYDGMSPYRFTYKAIVGGQHVGFVAYDGAYRRGKWWLCAIHLPEPGDRREVNYQLADDPEARYPVTLSFPTKEAALMAAPALVEAKRLPTVEELAEQRREAKAWLAKREAQIAAHDQEAKERNTMIREGLQSLSERDDLSNLERSAVVAALASYTPVNKEEAA